MAEQGFTLTSPDFVPDGSAPIGMTCDGDNTAPELRWTHPPEGAQSFALIVDDPDAPHGTFTHWLLWDIPASAKSIPAGGGSVGVSGRNDFHHEGYGGLCPPPNHGEHRYFFKLYALDAPSLNLEHGATRDQLEAALDGHVIEQTEVMARFERTTG